MCAKTTACLIARSVSTRLPLKAFRLVDQNTSMLDYIIKRIKFCKRVDEIYLCTSKEMVDDIMEDVAWKNDIKLYRGSADAVIERMLDVGEETSSDFLIRITGDNIFTSYEYIDAQIDAAVKNRLEYVRVIDAPLGATAEIMEYNALKRCYHSIDPAVSEYLMLFMFNPDAYRCGVIRPFEESYGNYSLTVDYPTDFIRTKEILKHVSRDNFLTLTLEQIIQIIKQYDVPHSIVESSGTIKLPYGKEMTFPEFMDDMANRASKAFQIKIN